MRRTISQLGHKKETIMTSATQCNVSTSDDNVFQDVPETIPEFETSSAFVGWAWQTFGTWDTAVAVLAEHRKTDEKLDAHMTEQEQRISDRENAARQKQAEAEAAEAERQRQIAEGEKARQAAQQAAEKARAEAAEKARLEAERQAEQEAAFNEAWGPLSQDESKWLVIDSPRPDDVREALDASELPFAECGDVFHVVFDEPIDAKEIAEQLGLWGHRRYSLKTLPEYSGTITYNSKSPLAPCVASWSGFRSHFKLERKYDLFKFGDLMPNSAFMALDSNVDFLIDDVLPKGAYGVIGAKMKHFKTYVSLDAAVSVASGTPFLDKFNTKKGNVIFVASESYITDLQRQQLCILEGRGLTLAHVGDRINWSKRLPDISDPASIDGFGEMCRQNPGSLMILDPLNLCLGDYAGQNANRAVIQNALAQLSMHTQSQGITLLVNHHCGDSLYPRAKPSLSHLSHAGVGEWARFWLLQNELKAYDDSTGKMDMHFVVGGNSPFGGSYVLSVDEGPKKDHWKPKLSLLTEHKAAVASAKEAKKADGVEELAQRMLEGFQQAGKGVELSDSDIERFSEVDATRGSKKFKDARDLLVERKDITKRVEKAGKREFTYYSLS